MLISSFLLSAQEINIKESELVNLRKQIEKEFGEKVKLEDHILSKLQGQLTADKASQYTKKMREKIRRKATETVLFYIYNVLKLCFKIGSGNDSDSTYLYERLRLKLSGFL